MQCRASAPVLRTVIEGHTAGSGQVGDEIITIVGEIKSLSRNKVRKPKGEGYHRQLAVVRGTPKHLHLQGTSEHPARSWALNTHLLNVETRMVVTANPRVARPVSGVTWTA